MNKADILIQRMNELNTFIDDAYQKLQKGEVANLTRLDNEVALLCEQTLKLAPTEAVKVQPVMGDMISKLESFSVSLKDFQTELKAKK